MNYNKKIHIHPHILTPAYFEYLDKYEGPTPDNFATPKWSEKAHLKLMDDLGVAFSLMSVSSPHIIKAQGAERIDFCRRMNEEGLVVVSHHPDRLGLFAILPLPDVDAACKMAEEYLKKDGIYGIGVMTNYDGMYLGSDKMDPLLKVLNKKKAVVCVHPAMPAAIPGDALPNFPIPTMDFLMDTTRAFTNMVWYDKFIKYPDIKWIWPHGASFMTIESDRFANFSVLAKKNGNKNKLDYYGAMKHCWFDTAGFSVPKQLDAMRLDIPMDHFLYGSDCPYTPNIVCKALAGQLESTNKLSKKEKKMMFTTNGQELIPGLDDIMKGVKGGSRKDSHMRKVFGKVIDVVDARLKK